MRSTALRMHALCTRRSRSTFEQRSREQRRRESGRPAVAFAPSRGPRRRSGLLAAVSTPRGSSRGPRGAPARCASCTSRGGPKELSKTSARRTFFLRARSRLGRVALPSKFGCWPTTKRKQKKKEKKRREHSPIRDAPPLLCPVVLLLPTENVSLPVSARRDAERESNEPQLPEYFF